MKRLCVCLIVFIFSSTAAAEDDTPVLTIEHAWIREAPPSAQVLAGYMTLVNGGDATILVTRVSSPGFASVELHRTLVEDGVARMLPIGQLEVPAHGRQVLEPGGQHLMLINPQQAFSDGDSVTLDIEYADGSCMRINAPVLRKTGTGGTHHQHHH